MKMNVDIFIPIRLDSTRLANKHLLKIEEKPLLKYLIERLKKAKKIRKIIVCTTNTKYDDLLVKFLQIEGINYFRGDENNILKRFLDAAKKFSTDIIIDVEGDDFYTDPFFVDQIVNEMQNSDYDFVSGNASANSFDAALGYPHGLVPAGIRTVALEKIYKLKGNDISDTGYKELFMTGIFKQKYLVPKSEIKYSENLRLTIDYKEDYELAKKVVEELDNDFNFQSLLKLFEDKPQLLKIVEPVIKKWQKNYDSKKQIINEEFFK